jgi:hypothetical protein
MPSPTALRPRRPAQTSRLTRRMPALIAIAIAVVVLAALWSPFAAPPTVDIEVVNPTRRDIHVSVQSAGDSSVVGIGTVGPEHTYRFGEVVEHGAQWVFTFSAAGSVGGELSLSRRQLAESGWTITVPAEVDRELARAGVPVSP